MKRYSLFLGVFLVSLGLNALAEPGVGSNGRALFGELHTHTSFSFDAYLFTTRATPDDAYNFAKGKPLEHAMGRTYQLTRPLDFMAVTDHGIFMGVYGRMNDPEHPMSKLPIAEQARKPGEGFLAFREMIDASRSGNPIPGTDSPDVRKEAWDHIIDAANRHNDPGSFTALIAYEWTSTPDGQNLHRNVIFKGDSAPLPFTANESMNPEDLWAWMDGIRAEGNPVLAIPHNVNISDGRAFMRTTFDGGKLTPDYAETRNRNEPLVEVTQIKGTSEAHPELSPNDEFADFEILELYVAQPTSVTNFVGGYVRSAYRTGLELQDENGFNPYRFGLIGASDSHSGVSEPQENNFEGPASARSGSPEIRITGENGTQRFSNFGASGLAGVWAEENTRGDVFDALARKESWATTGPRIQVRFFGEFDMDGVEPGMNNWVDAAYAKGVAMGGSLNGSNRSKAPTFTVWAIKDPEAANLDRIQIVKGWSKNGESQENVFDVAWSGNRSVDRRTGNLSPVGNTVDLDSLEYTNSIGAVELSATWTDPDFNPKQNAFYYVRVLEIPTPRWSAFDAKALGIDHPDHKPATIQERAYTSPIWYDHH